MAALSLLTPRATRPDANVVEVAGLADRIGRNRRRALASSREAPALQASAPARRPGDAHGRSARLRARSAGRRRTPASNAPRTTRPHSPGARWPGRGSCARCPLPRTLQAHEDLQHEEDEQGDNGAEVDT